MSMRRPGRLDMVGEISERGRSDVDGSKGARYAQQPVESQSRDSSQSLFVIQTNTGQESARGGAAEKGDGWLQLPRSPATANAALTDDASCPRLLSLVPAQPLVQLPARSRSRSQAVSSIGTRIGSPSFRSVKLVPRGCLRFGCSESDVSDGWALS
ncbi:hypothetical protein L1887_54402 [Cichorium endivia]|nr:hypothetical protein L1887_54402 [Cichorium endivia]